MFDRNKKGGKKSVFLYRTVDERTKSIAYQGDAYMGRFLLLAVLLDVLYRGFRYNNYYKVNERLKLFLLIFSWLYYNFLDDHFKKEAGRWKWYQNISQREF